MLRKKNQPSQPDDELTRRLREAARKKRPWSRTGLLLIIALVVVPAALLVWLLRPRPEPPRLDIVAFDQLALPGEAVPLHARVEPLQPAEEPVDLAGLAVFFSEGPLLAAQDNQVQAATTEAGDALADLPFKREKASLEFQVHLAGDRERRGARDRAHVYFRPAKTPLLVVDVLHVLSSESLEGWGSKNVLQIKPRPEAGLALQEAHKKKFQVVYLATQPQSARDYRRFRGWVENRIQGREAFPPGPVLGRNSFTQEESAPRQQILRSLKERFQGHIVTVVGSSEGAAVGRALNLDTIMLGDEVGPAEVIRIPSLKNLRAKLP